jgi:hypothetical protein
MISRHHDAAQTTLTSLEADAAITRSGFACLFSSSDEYERALIALRRTQGRYRQPFRHWPVLLFAGCLLLVAGTVLLFG